MEKGWHKVAIETFSKVDKIKNTVSSEHRLGVTDFARSKKWREDLIESDVIEVVDRTETAGYLISPAGMKSIISRINELEKELERARVDALFDARKDIQNWTTGEKLVENALQNLDELRKHIRGSLDGDN